MKHTGSLFMRATCPKPARVRCCCKSNAMRSGSWISPKAPCEARLTLKDGQSPVFHTTCDRCDCCTTSVRTPHFLGPASILRALWLSILQLKIDSNTTHFTRYFYSFSNYYSHKFLKSNLGNNDISHFIYEIIILQNSYIKPLCIGLTFVHEHSLQLFIITSNYL